MKSIVYSGANWRLRARPERVAVRASFVSGSLAIFVVSSRPSERSSLITGSSTCVLAPRAIAPLSVCIAPAKSPRAVCSSARNRAASASRYGSGLAAAIRESSPTRPAVAGVRSSAPKSMSLSPAARRAPR